MLPPLPRSFHASLGFRVNLSVHTAQHGIRASPLTETLVVQAAATAHRFVPILSLGPPSSQPPQGFVLLPPSPPLLTGRVLLPQQTLTPIGALGLRPLHRGLPVTYSGVATPPTVSPCKDVHSRGHAEPFMSPYARGRHVGPSHGTQNGTATTDCCHLRPPPRSLSASMQS